MTAASRKIRDRIRNACIRLFACILPPPYYDPKMEFRYGVWGGVSSMHCRNGRQLGENNVVPHRLKETVPTELQVYRNGGSREGRYFNKPALRHAMGNWDPAMALIGDMRREYLRRRGSGGEALGLFDVYTLAKQCVCLPAWQTRQRLAPLKDRRLDPVIATVYQLTAGMFMVIRRMLARGEPWLDERSRMNPEELYDYADRHGVFLSPNGHACGGSRRKIIELMDFLINGTGNGRHAGREEGLEVATRDPEGFYRYGMHALALEALLKLARAGTARYFCRAQPAAADRICAVLDPDGDMVQVGPAGVAIQRQFDLHAGLIRHFGYAPLAAGFPGESGRTMPDDLPAGYGRILAYTLSEAEELQNRINFLLRHRQRVGISAAEMDEALSLAPMLAALPKGIRGAQPDPRLALVRLARHLQPRLQRLRKT